MIVLQIMSHTLVNSMGEFYFDCVIELLGNHGISVRFYKLVKCCLNFTDQITKLNKLSHLSISVSLIKAFQGYTIILRSYIHGCFLYNLLLIYLPLFRSAI
jgi:hypothetical protein